MEEFYASREAVSHGVADEILAMTGARDSATSVVGIGASADDRSVTDTAPALA